MYNTFTHCIPSYATFYNSKDPSASTSYDYHIGFKLPSQVHSLLIVYCLTPTDNSLKNISCNYLLPINGLIIVGTILYCFFLKINDYFYLINWLFLLFHYFYFILISLYYLIKHRVIYFFKFDYFCSSITLFWTSAGACSYFDTTYSKSPLPPVIERSEVE